MNKRQKDSQLLPFHVCQAAALSSGTALITGNPAGIGGRSLIEADAWSHFRFRKLKFRLAPGTTTVGSIAAGWVGGIQDTPPATFATVMELLPSTFTKGNLTVYSEWVNVTKADLQGALPWYKTIAGAATDVEEQPGQLVLAGSASDSYFLEIKGVIEFKTAVASGNTPAELVLREKLRAERINRHLAHEQQRVVALLAGPTATSSVRP